MDGECCYIQVPLPPLGDLYPSQEMRMECRGCGLVQITHKYLAEPGSITMLSRYLLYRESTFAYG